MAANGAQINGGHGQQSQDILKEMRGWLMTVGTLFVTMAFQAALQPPAWMRTVDFLRERRHPFGGASHAAATAPAMQFAPSPGPSPQAAESTEGLSARAWAYMAFNVFTFASALSLVLRLLWDIPPAKAKRRMKAAKWMMVAIGLGVVGTFALGSSDQLFYTGMVVILAGLYGCTVVYFVTAYADEMARAAGAAGPVG